jgi:prefoldin subunit 5
MKAIVIPLVFCLFLLAGCEDSKSQKRIAELESQNETLQSQLETIQNDFDEVTSAFDEVKSALDLLQGEVADFGSENWRTNVPDVEDATYFLESSINDLEIAINNVDLGY